MTLVKTVATARSALLVFMFPAGNQAKCQTVYKPGFVQGVDPSVRPFIWDLARARPLATYPDTPTHKRAVTQRAVPHGVPIRSCS